MTVLPLVSATDRPVQTSCIAMVAITGGMSSSLTSRPLIRPPTTAMPRAISMPTRITPPAGASAWPAMYCTAMIVAKSPRAMKDMSILPQMKQNIRPSVTTPYSGNCMAMPSHTSPFQSMPPLSTVKNSSTTAIRPSSMRV